MTSTPTNTPVPQGGACADTSQCVAGFFCSDSVCCDTACNGNGQRCNIPDHQGTCIDARAGVPAASHGGLMVLLAALFLVAVAGLTVRRRE